MRPPRPSYYDVHPSAHPAIKKVFAEMKHQLVTISDVATRSGVNRVTISAWRKRNIGSLANVEAVLNVLGFNLTPTRRR